MHLYEHASIDVMMLFTKSHFSSDNDLKTVYTVLDSFVYTRKFEYGICEKAITFLNAQYIGHSISYLFFTSNSHRRRE